MLPWLGHTLIGTTDISVSCPDYSDTAPQDDIDWLLRTSSQALKTPIDAAQITASLLGTVRWFECQGQEKNLLNFHELILLNE
jgi:glycerol-3-phosphate dehydrogenase